MSFDERLYATRGRSELLAEIARLLEENDRLTKRGGDFKLGRYRHYKGGLYTAIGLATHHETRKPMVLYTADAHPCDLNVRPLHGWSLTAEGSQDPDGWAGLVPAEGFEPPNTILHVPRFQLVP